MVLKMDCPDPVTEEAVAPVVIPATTAVNPTTPFEIAPASLSIVDELTTLMILHDARASVDRTPQNQRLS